MRRTAAVLLLGVALTACQATTSRTAHSTAWVSPTTPIQAGHLLGAPGCQPPSPAGPWAGSTWPAELRGTVKGGELWALPFFALPPKSGTDLKIVTRMTGKGMLRLWAIGPSGQSLMPDWGPEGHGGSNWSRPGDEWGAGFTFPVPGCWDLHAMRQDVAGDIYLVVS